MPALAAPATYQRVLWALWILTATCLVVVNASRVWRHVDWSWWIPLTMLLGVAAADFSSGLVHWAADTWGRSDLPLIGPRFLVPFRVHHINPDDFLSRAFLDTNGDAAALTIPVLVGLLRLPMDTVETHALVLFGVAFCAAGGMTNQIHQWAHSPAPPAPICALQHVGLLLSRGDHATHHDRPYDAHYCITTGWCNRPLEVIGFFRRLEAGITRMTGAQPREDEWTHHPCGRMEQDA